jgi:hypothetical protein
MYSFCTFRLQFQPAAHTHNNSRAVIALVLPPITNQMVNIGRGQLIGVAWGVDTGHHCPSTLMIHVTQRDPSETCSGGPTFANVRLRHMATKRRVGECWESWTCLRTALLYGEWELGSSGCVCPVQDTMWDGPGGGWWSAAVMVRLPSLGSKQTWQPLGLGALM